MIIQTAHAHQGELTIICLGPLTNLATALTLEPSLFMAIRRIIMMGGSSTFPMAKWNVRSDARAAQIVLAAGIPVTMIGFNVTMRCHLRQSELERLHNNATPQVQLLSNLIAIWQRHRPRWHSRFPFLHDPLTIAALCKPELLRFEEMPVRALTHGPFKGYMIPRVMNGPWVNAAVDVRVKAAREWIMQRLL